MKISKNDSEKFRNANGIALKLANFLAIDPNHPGVGVSRYSILDLEIFKEFENDITGLRREVQRINVKLDYREPNNKLKLN